MKPMKTTAIVWDDSKAFFFRGSGYTRYDIGSDQADEGYPKQISSGWPGVFDRDIDAAVVWPNGKAYFFRGSEYIRYDIGSDQADEGYPQQIISGWPGVFDRDIEAVIVWPNQKAYFFRGNDYIRYDIGSDQADEGFPQTIISGWPGVVQTEPPMDGSATDRPQNGRNIASLFDFEIRPGEAIGDRIVRCCEEALNDGPMGQHERHDFYRDF